jgi:hypothetical protein
VTAANSKARWVLVAAALLLAVFAAQALGAVSAPSGATVSTQSMLGQTGFEYLGGVRKFAAAVLWNRLEPQFHEYGVGAVDHRLEFLPTMHLVQALDPQFQQAYYVSTFMLARNGRMPQALALAREGIANNPKAGLMRASYVQLLLMEDKVKNLPEAIKQARVGIEPDTTWASPDDRFEGYGIFRTVFTLAGDKATAQKLQDAQNELSGQGAGLGVERD